MNQDQSVEKSDSKVQKCKGVKAKTIQGRLELGPTPYSGAHPKTQAPSSRAHPNAQAPETRAPTTPNLEVKDKYLMTKASMYDDNRNGSVLLIQKLQY